MHSAENRRTLKCFKVLIFIELFHLCVTVGSLSELIRNNLFAIRSLEILSLVLRLSYGLDDLGFEYRYILRFFFSARLTDWPWDSVGTVVSFLGNKAAEA